MLNMVRSLRVEVVPFGGAKTPLTVLKTTRRGGLVVGAVLS